ncbi:Karyogamy protein, KAR9 [Ophiocordyceps camponoti-floridani]|uniref:Karyogamy protein, KAR9 n=1 Tax=Ophiocordyceps camponoti-floridani TaxID=2030778 RepID=A0A8H4VG25_9HYPO|nr:Karyogamy protein, KAR9 [Ophiocordyceps camponoti-floridani]
MTACDGVHPPSLLLLRNDDEADADVVRDGARDSDLTLPVHLGDATSALACLSLPSPLDDDHHQRNPPNHRHHQHNHLPPSPPQTATGRSHTSLPYSTQPISSIGTGPGSLTSTSLQSSSALDPTLPKARQRPHSFARKPSPGLAARLRALGFGSSSAKKSSSTSAASRPDSVGRLDEDQLRQLHDKLQAASPLGAVVTKRGRPWKGPSLSPTTPNPPPAVSDLDGPAMDTHEYRHTTSKFDLRHVDIRPPSPEDDSPPPPPPKDTPLKENLPPKDNTPPLSADAAPSDYTPGLSSYFNSGRQRPVSIYTLSRASFANQLAQLTSLQLPHAESLSSEVSAIPNAQVAAKALINAAEQIRSWIFKAHDVIDGLDGEDDVEWAAAGGREGLDEVENAISRFSHLINVYVGAIEELQSRQDVSSVSSDDLRRAVEQMETILDEWAKMRATLCGVRNQVEMAMEWEELWNTVLGDIQSEMDELSRLVFEMEERRHKSGDMVDMADLETTVDDDDDSRQQASNRPSLTSLTSLTLSPPQSSASPNLSADDSGLLALFARMQPLRASLDFLPMRLSVFEARAEASFPTACEELEMRRNGLDASYKKLERDAESLRKELGEDRWVMVFRGAGRQAQKMVESVQRSLTKLREAFDAGLQLSNPAAMMKKIEGYEAKKLHYGPAIERVLSIIEKGLKERLTVNGEIVRLHTDSQYRWEALKARIAEVDALLDDMPQTDRKGHLRDSVSSLLSMDRSTLASGHDTPGSSPTSSIIMSSLGLDPHTPMTNKAKGLSPSAISLPGRTRPSPPTTRRMGPRVSTTTTMTTTKAPNAAAAAAAPSPPSMVNRPRWNTSTNISKLDTNLVAGGSSPLSAAITPSPHARSTPGGLRSSPACSPSVPGCRLPAPRSAPPRASSESPRVRDLFSRSVGSSRLVPPREPSSSPYTHHFASKPRTLLSKSSMSALTAKGRSGASSLRPGEGGFAKRPASSLALTSRRTSHIPMPLDKATHEGRTGSRMSSTSRCSTRKADGKDARPKWRA